MAMAGPLTPDSMKFSFLIYLFELMEARDWIMFERVARSNRKTFKYLSESIADCEDFNGMTLLHAVARHDPPAKLFRWMIKICPRALMGEDCMGRTPLHVATGTGASLPVVEVLTQMYPPACDVQDMDGRTPLHYASDAHCELFEDDECAPRGPPNIDVIRALLTASLGSVTIEDETETNAVEYAILSDAPLEVVTLLQRVSLMVLKRDAPNGNSSTLLEAPAGQSETGKLEQEEDARIPPTPFNFLRSRAIVPSKEEDPPLAAARLSKGEAKDEARRRESLNIKRKSTASTAYSSEELGEELSAGKGSCRGFGWY